MKCSDAATSFYSTIETVIAVASTGAALLCSNNVNE